MEGFSWMFCFGSCQNQSLLGFFVLFFFSSAFSFSPCLSGAPFLQTQGSLAAEPPRLWHSRILVGEGRGKNAESPFPCSLELQRPGHVLSLRAHLEAIQAEQLLSSGGEGKEGSALLPLRISKVHLCPTSPPMAPALLQPHSNGKDSCRALK